MWSVMLFASLLAMFQLMLYLICKRDMHGIFCKTQVKRESKAVLALLEALQTLQALQGRGVGRGLAGFSCVRFS